MRPSDFHPTHWGDVRFDETDRVHWYSPSPLPRHLDLDEETQLALSRADASIGRLDGLAQLLANPDVIARPYAAREAVASSRIEGTQATVTEVYESEAGKPTSVILDVRAIEAYTVALNHGLRSVSGGHRLDLETLRDVHRRLVDYDPHGQHHGGEWRTGPVWLGSPTGGPETAVFVPPYANELQPLLDDWADWHAHPPRMPLLIRTALLHYQFLTIHPFLDGNGRVGRMLIQMVLEEERALSAPLLYVSAYFAKHRREYYDRLQDVRQRGEIQQWLQFFLTAVHVQAEDGVARAQGLLKLREQYRSGVSGSRSRVIEVVDMLFENPVISASRVMEQLEVTNQGALNLLRGLEGRGWLTHIGQHRRGGAKFWIAPEILGRFDDEAMSGRQNA